MEITKHKGPPIPPPPEFNKAPPPAMDEFNMMTDYNPADIADINVSDLLMGYGNNKT